jgi:tRNA threonylcarbamoyladenosine biosynthesis protein TsaB
VRILALDTATENCSVALLIGRRLIAREQLLEHGHAERILPMVDELLQEAKVSLGALSAIAFGRGPGSFTGVRLAASVTQGLAFGAGLPVVPISDLRALAQRVMELDAGVTRVLVCNDARMHEVYWGCFERLAPEGFAAAAQDEQVSKPAAVTLPASWSGAQRAVVHAAGSGFAAYPELRSALAGHLDRVHDGLLPRAAEIARLAAREVACGHVLPAEQALPVYVRDNVAHATGGSH